MINCDFAVSSNSVGMKGLNDISRLCSNCLLCSVLTCYPSVLREHGRAAETALHGLLARS